MKLLRFLSRHELHVFIAYPDSGHFLSKNPDCAAQYRQAILEYARTNFPQNGSGE